MTVEKLTDPNIPAFKIYFKIYFHEQDEPNSPLNDFCINDNVPNCRTKFWIIPVEFKAYIASFKIIFRSLVEISYIRMTPKGIIN